MTRAMERSRMTPEDALSLRKNVHQATQKFRSKFAQPLLHTGLPSGPSIVVDEYNLPVSTGTAPQPVAVRRRRKFLRNLPPQTRNLLLTGDPVFAFDPLVYATVLAAPRAVLPPLLQHEFDYLPPPAPPTPPPPTPPPPPDVDDSLIENESPPPDIHRQPWWPATPTPHSGPQPGSSGLPPPPDDAGEEGHNTLPSGSYYLRSSPSSADPLKKLQQRFKTSWAAAKAKSAELSDDMLLVPPPGWKPKTARTPPPSRLARLATSIRDELSHPPVPYPDPPTQESTRPQRPRGVRHPARHS